MKLKIIADNKIPFLRGALEEKADVRYLPGKEIDRVSVRDADALIVRTRTLCNESLLKGSSVKFIATATIGFDHIDTSWCEQNGIAWTNAPGCNSSSVQQYLVSALLNIFTDYCPDPATLTMGIVGVGNVGSKVAKAAEVLGMKVLLNDPPRQRNEKSDQFCDLEKILQQADIISFHVPLTRTGPDKTFQMADKSFFGKLGKSVILFNTSRGGIVVQSDLKKAIAGQQVKACVLDVWEGEPLIDSEMLDLAYLGTPHIAGYSTDGKVNGTTMSLRALDRYFKLGLEEWYPSDVPLPTDPVIQCDCSGKTEVEILKEIYLQTYDIRQDNSRLRKDIAKFEYLRESYPLRREPAAYSVHLINNKIPGLGVRLGKLGFMEDLLIW